jgi:hypothetical protein
LAWYYVVSIFIQATDFIDRATVDSDLFANFYQFSTLAINILIAPVAGLLFFREYYQRRSQLKLQGL